MPLRLFMSAVQTGADRLQRWSAASQREDDGQDQADNKQYPGNIRGCTCDSGETENCSHNGYDKKCKSPTNHDENLQLSVCTRVYAGTVPAMHVA